MSVLCSVWRKKQKKNVNIFQGCIEYTVASCATVHTCFSCVMEAILFIFSSSQNILIESDTCILFALHAIRTRIINNYLYVCGSSFVTMTRAFTHTFFSWNQQFGRDEEFVPFKMVVFPSPSHTSKLTRLFHLFRMLGFFFIFARELYHFKLINIFRVCHNKAFQVIWVHYILWKCAWNPYNQLMIVKWFRKHIFSLCKVSKKVYHVYLAHKILSFRSSHWIWWCQPKVIFNDCSKVGSNLI